MIDRSITNAIRQCAANARENKNERILERVVKYLDEEIRSIKLARDGDAVRAAMLRHAADASFRILEERADHFEEQAFTEALPPHVQEMPPEEQRYWSRAYKDSLRDTGSVRIAVMVADQVITHERELNEG